MKTPTPLEPDRGQCSEWESRYREMRRQIERHRQLSAWLLNGQRARRGVSVAVWLRPRPPSQPRNGK